MLDKLPRELLHLCIFPKYYYNTDENISINESLYKFHIIDRFNLVINQINNLIIEFNYLKTLRYNTWQNCNHPFIYIIYKNLEKKHLNLPLNSEIENQKNYILSRRYLNKSYINSSLLIFPNLIIPNLIV